MYQSGQRGVRGDVWRVEDHIGIVMVVGPWCCWILPNKPTPAGYTAIRANGKLQYAHRAFYKTLIGKIPRNLQLDHLCRHTWCCNPNHVEPVTGQVNTLRGDTIPAMHARKTACIHGHKFNRKNTIKHGPNGRWRLCRACRTQSRKRG